VAPAGVVGGDADGDARPALAWRVAESLTDGVAAPPRPAGVLPEHAAAVSASASETIRARRDMGSIIGAPEAQRARLLVEKAVRPGD